MQPKIQMAVLFYSAVKIMLKLAMWFSKFNGVVKSKYYFLLMATLKQI